MRVTAEDLAANPRLRAAVSAARLRDLAAAVPAARNPPAAKTAARPPVRSPGRAATNQHRCHICQVLHPSYAAAERHADTHNGGLGARIENVL